MKKVFKTKRRVEPDGIEMTYQGYRIGRSTSNPQLGVENSISSPSDKHVVRIHDSRVVFWDILILLLLFYQTWSIPFQIGVSGGHLWKFMGIWGLLFAESMNFLFLCDSILYFFRETRDENGRLVWRLKDTATRYAKGWFLPDLLSCVPVDTIAYATEAYTQKSPLFHILEIMQILKLLRLARIRRRLRGSPTIQKFLLRLSMVPLQMAYIFSISLYVAHCMACVWCFVSNLEDEKSWMEKFLNSSTDVTQLTPTGDDFGSILDFYVLALYWAAVTLVSLGYGDITPYTRAEYWICAACIMISAFLWAWVVAQMVDLVSKIQHEESELNDKLAVINRFSTERAPSDKIFRKEWDNLMDEARLYIQTNYEQRKRYQSTSRFNETLQSLSSSLRIRVSLAQAESTLLKIPCFCSARVATIAFLGNSMQLKSLACGEVLMDDDADILQRERGLYFMQSGACFASDRSKNEADINTTSRDLLLADQIFRDIIRGTISTDKIFETSAFKESRLTLLSPGDVWDVDRCILDRSSPLFRPARLFAINYCEFNFLPRSAFLEAMQFDETFRKAVRYRVARIGLANFAKEQKDKGINSHSEQVDVFSL